MSQDLIQFIKSEISTGVINAFIREACHFPIVTIATSMVDQDYHRDELRVVESFNASRIFIQTRTQSDASTPTTNRKPRSWLRFEDNINDFIARP